MKISKISLLLLCALFVFPTFGQDKAASDKKLFNFSATTLEAPKAVEVKVVPKESETKAESKAEDKTLSKAEDPAPALVADAETRIKDNLVQRYQVRLDEVIVRMTNRLSTVSPSEQRIALGDLRDRMAEKKAVVVDMKDLEALRKDTIVAILDHVIYRLE